MIASSEQEKFTKIPKLDGLLSDEKLDYVHITTNNTIEGTKYVDIPHVEKSAARCGYVLKYFIRAI